MGNIYHEWNGTVLTVTSDSGTSSADLKGDMGVRGPQGIPGGEASELIDELAETVENKMDKFGEVDEFRSNIYLKDEDMTAFHGYEIALATQERLLFTSAAGTVCFNNSKLCDVASPVEPTQAANKQYVDGLVGDISTALTNIEAIQDALIGGNE